MTAYHRHLARTRRLQRERRRWRDLAADGIAGQLGHLFGRPLVFSDHLDDIRRSVRQLRAGLDAWAEIVLRSVEAAMPALDPPDGWPG